MLYSCIQACKHESIHNHKHDVVAYHDSKITSGVMMQKYPHRVPPIFARMVNYVVNRNIYYLEVVDQCLREMFILMASKVCMVKGKNSS